MKYYVIKTVYNSDLTQLITSDSIMRCDSKGDAFKKARELTVGNTLNDFEFYGVADEYGNMIDEV